MNLTKDQIIETLKRADAVFLNVYGTVCPGNGLDEFAAFHGVDEEVKRLVEREKEGSVTFHEALTTKIRTINPTYMRLKTFLHARTPVVRQGATEFIGCLKERGCRVYLISEGLSEIISIPAKMVGIPREDILANKLLYYYTGECLGVDGNLSMCKSKGKSKVIKTLKDEHCYDNIVMVGDSEKDMEACPPADAFIGYGGIVVRPAVHEKAEWFVHSFQEIMDALKE